MFVGFSKWAAGLACALFVCLPSSAKDNFPNRPVRLLHGFQPGGAADMLARRLAAGLQATLGQPVIVDSRPGAGSVIAARQVLQAAPDGYTLFLGDSGLSLASQSQAELGVDPRDYTALGVVGSMSYALVVPARGAATSVGDLILQLRAHPGGASYGTPGPWTMGERSAQAFVRAAGVGALAIAYKGGAPMLGDLFEGRLQFGFISLPLALEQAHGGRLNILAVTSRERSALSRETPSLAETLGDFHVVSNAYLFGPPHMAPSIQRALANALRTLARQPEWREQLLAVGFNPQSGEGQAVARMLEAERRGGPGQDKELRATP